MAKRYELNEKDIDSVIRFLQLTDPKHATPEMAIEILETMMATAHGMAHEDPELLEKIWLDLKKKKNLA